MEKLTTSSHSSLNEIKAESPLEALVLIAPSKLARVP